MHRPIWLVSCQLMKLGRRQTEQLAPHNSCDEFVDADEAREGVVALVLHVLHCGVVWCWQAPLSRHNPRTTASLQAAFWSSQRRLLAQYQLEQCREDMDVDCTRA